jgi:hypothetical protein
MAEADLIRTPDQRVRVFVSSALQELTAERQAAREAITGLRLLPVMFELGARPHPARDVYRSYLAQSQVFLGIYWQSYGWVPAGEEISGLEDEYLLSAGLPRLIYVKAPAPDRDPRLAKMLGQIRDEGDVSYQRFSDPAELRHLVENDLAVLLSERFVLAEEGGDPSRPGQPASRLPAPPTPLLGRERDVQAILDLGRRAAGLLHRARRRGQEQARPGGSRPAELAARRRRAPGRPGPGPVARPGGEHDRRGARAEDVGGSHDG